MKKLVRRIKLKIDFFFFYFGAVGATGGDPLSEFCNDLEKAPDEVHVL